MANERPPRVLRPRGYLPPQSFPHPIRDGQNWKTLAELYGVSASKIILHNFWTDVPEEVNWYLREYVGCTKETNGNRVFSSDARPGIIWIPHKKFSFVTDVGTLPGYFEVKVHPDKWKPPADVAGGVAAARAVVSWFPWVRPALRIGGLEIRTRIQWGAKEPAWKNEVVYYNTFSKPLKDRLVRIVVHHTDNSDSIKAVEEDKKEGGYAAIGYHFFIDKQGTISEGRPLEIMGSHAGEGVKKGKRHDPDWGAIGIALQGDYHAAWGTSDTVLKVQLEQLEKLVVALNKEYPNATRLLMHKEVKGRKAPLDPLGRPIPEDCPGDQMVDNVKNLRKKLNMQGP